MHRKMTVVVKADRGQTLLEMLMAIALVALVLVGLVAGSVVGL